MEQWLEELLYRGRPPSGPGSEMAAAWHVVVGQQVANPFDPSGPPQRQTVGPMTPEQALGMGISLPDFVAQINADALAQLAEQGATIAEQAATITAQQAEILRLNEAIEGQPLV